MARIILRHEGHTSEYRITGVTMIGRQSTNDIVVLTEKASRQHARITPSGRQFVLEDLGSSNGTFVNGIKIQRHTLEHGDEIRIGDAILTFMGDLSTSLEGQTLGNYRIHNKIGQGGMGTVYKATQISMDRIVALKILRDELSSDREFVKAFLNEARAAGRLNHPNVVRVHDFGEVGGIYYFSMEYVDGETVEDILKREGKLSVGRALDIVRQVASALDHAHSLGIIHRDIKPQNIMIDRHGQVKLMDLGLARMAGREASDRRKNAIMGTPYYMAPECAQLMRTDARTDIYSLGATFFHMLTGRVPFDGANSLAVITKHIHEPLPSPRRFDVTIPERICQLVERMMAKNPEMRPASAKALVEEIAEIQRSKTPLPQLAPSPPPPPPKPSAAPAPRPVRVVRVGSGSPVTYMLIGALGVAILGLILWVSMSGKERGTARARAPTIRPATSSPVVESEEIEQKLSEAEEASSSGNYERARELAREVLVTATDPKSHERARRILRSLPTIKVAVNSEAVAKEELASIKAQLAANPEGKVYATRRLRLLAEEHPDTSAAAEARRMYKELSGTDMPEPGRRSSSETPRPVRETRAPPKPIDEKAAAEAFDKARNASSEAEARSDLHAARAALVQFIEEYRGSRKEAEAAELLDMLDNRIRRGLKLLMSRAELLSKRAQYAQAEEVLREIIQKDPIGEDSEKAQKMLEDNKASARRMRDDAVAKAESLFKASSFEEASREFERAAKLLAGTQWEKELAIGAESAKLSGELVERFSKRLASRRGVAPVLERTGKGGKTVSLIMLRASAGGLTVRDGPVERLIPWGELAPDELIRVFESMPMTAEDRLGLGAFLLRRGEKALAAQELRKARSEPSLRAKVDMLLAALEESSGTRRFEFSRFDDVDSWELEGGEWIVKDGKLVRENPQEGRARLKGRTYRADGLKLSFELTFLEPGGLLEVQLGQEPERCVWFSLSSGGYEARASSGGNSVSERSDWTPKLGEPQLVKCSIENDVLSVSIAGKAMKPLQLPGLGGLEGSLTLRSQGGRLALDNIEISQD